ncbi:hypothetical protein RSK20926_12954 [Roseobacter sp. SK209-2-6]|nr:hypothetical protein RSK20926_12954 [Roseobacter sp. SK209-2-6]
MSEPHPQSNAATENNQKRNGSSVRRADFLGVQLRLT